MSDPDVASDDAGEATGRRDVVVPMRLYKTITVFSTLIATACILAGFILIDAATLQVSILRSVLLGGLAAIGLAVEQEVFTALLGTSCWAGWRRSDWPSSRRSSPRCWGSVA